MRFLDRYADGRVLYAPTAQRNGEVTAGSRRYENAAITGTSADIAEIRDLGIAAGRFFRPRRGDARRAGGRHRRRRRRDAVPGAGPAGRTHPRRGPRLRGDRRAGAARHVGRRLAGPLRVDAARRPSSALYGAPATLQVFARAAEDVTDAGRRGPRARQRCGRGGSWRPGEADNFDLLTPEAARDFVFRLTAAHRRGGDPDLGDGAAGRDRRDHQHRRSCRSASARARSACGARSARRARQITHEVVAESLLVAIGGGVLGIVVAYAVVAIVGGVAGFPLQLQWSTVGWGLLASTLSGVVAGWYPARRAVRASTSSSRACRTRVT